MCHIIMSHLVLNDYNYIKQMVCNFEAVNHFCDL